MSFAPTHGSWHNRIEIFALHTPRRPPRPRACTGIRQFRGHIDDFVQSHSTRTAPSVRTKAPSIGPRRPGTSRPKVSSEPLCRRLRGLSGRCKLATCGLH
jgi:hypothetical protein